MCMYSYLYFSSHLNFDRYEQAQTEYVPLLQSLKAATQMASIIKLSWWGMGSCQEDVGLLVVPR